MKTTLTTAAALGIAALTLTGCSARDLARPDAPGPNAPTVIVQNQNWEDVEIFAHDQGRLFWLGRVASNRSQRFLISTAMVGIDDRLQILIRPVDGPHHFLTDAVQVENGEVVDLTVSHVPQLSRFSRHQRR